MPKADSSLKAFDLIHKHISTEAEEVWVLALNSNLHLIKKELIFRGTVDKCLIHPREIFKFLVVQSAVSFILVHNHPSGDPAPSKEDLNITKQIYLAGRLLEIPLIDHLIIAEKGYFSFADYRIIEKYQQIKSFKIKGADNSP